MFIHKDKDVVNIVIITPFPGNLYSQNSLAKFFCEPHLEREVKTVGLTNKYRAPRLGPVLVLNGAFLTCAPLREKPHGIIPPSFYQHKQQRPLGKTVCISCSLLQVGFI